MNQPPTQEALAYAAAVAADLLLDKDYITVPIPMANLLGLERAVLLRKIDEWCKSNASRASKTHYKGGHYWTYGSYEEWAKRLPFLGTARSLQRLFLSLEKDELLTSDVLATFKGDRRKWYRVNKPKLGLLYLSNPETQQESIVPETDGGHPAAGDEYKYTVPKVDGGDTKNGTVVVPKVDGGDAKSGGSSIPISNLNDSSQSLSSISPPTPQGEPKSKKEGKPIESNIPERTPTSPTSLQCQSTSIARSTNLNQDQTYEASLINDEKKKQLDSNSTDDQSKLNDVTSVHVETQPNPAQSKRPKYVWEVELGKPIPEFQNWWAKTHYEPQGGHWATGAYGHAYSEFYNKPEKTTNAIFPQFMAVHQVVAQNCQQQQFIGQQGVLPSYFALPPAPSQDNMLQLATTFRELVNNGARVALPQGIATPSCQQSVSWDSAQRTVIAPLPQLHHSEPSFLPQAVECWGKEASFPQTLAESDRTRAVHQESLVDQVERKRLAWKTPFNRPDIKKWVESTDGVELDDDGPCLV